MRSGRRSLRVDTLLRKEKEGTLTKYTNKPSVHEEEKTAVSEPVQAALMTGAGSIVAGLPAAYLAESGRLPGWAGPVATGLGAGAGLGAWYLSRGNKKTAALAMMPGGMDYSEGPETAPGAAVLDKERGRVLEAGAHPRNPTPTPAMQVLDVRGKNNRALSRDEIEGSNIKREDTRDFTATEIGPGTHLFDTGPQPLYKSSSLQGLRQQFLDKIGSKLEHAADLAGLGIMGAGVADSLQDRLRGGTGEGVLGEKGQIGTDVAGLGIMAAPYVHKLLTKAPGRLESGAILGGLGALAIPAIDNLQAKIRSKPGEDASKKQLLSHKTHDLMDLAGYGTFGALTAKDLASAKGLKNKAMEALHAGGYATLAAPHIENLVRDKNEPRTFDGTTRSMTDLAGLGMLAAPAAAHLLGGH